MERVTSTPLVNKHITPLKQRNISPIIVPEEGRDDEERRQRRDSAIMLKRLSNIRQNSSLNDSCGATDNEIKEHMKMCFQMANENKINIENVWNLKIIDYLQRFVTNEPLSVAATSLEISSKVYCLRVDSVYADGMRLANNLCRLADTNGDADAVEQEEGATDPEAEISRTQKKKKKAKHLKSGQKSTVSKNPPTLLSSNFQKIDCGQFGTTTRIDQSAVSNLFTSKLIPALGSATFLWGTEKAHLEHGKILEDSYKVPFKEYLRYGKLLQSFLNLDFAKWDPDDETKLEDNDMVVDEDGLPVPELDGSIPNIFAEPDEPNEAHEEGAMEEEKLTAHLQGNIVHIVDFQNKATTQENEYSYNKTLSIPGGKIIEQLWAGPSHWKLKCIRPNPSRFSGRPVAEEEQKKNKKTKIVPALISFLTATPEINMSTVRDKKKSTCLDPSKVRLPLVEKQENFIEEALRLSNKPCFCIKIKNTNDDELPVGPEVGPYDYNNLNDSLYCSQNMGANDDDAVEAGDIEEFGEGCTNLVEAPVTVPTSIVPYAKFAKKMNMKKLKSSVWECITEPDRTKKDPEDRKVKETTFSQMFKELPHHMNESMKSELSAPLAIFSLLHLANEHNLEVQDQPDLKDLKIRQG